jgi:GNAT superfamily N-acetyltransferase
MHQDPSSSTPTIEGVDQPDATHRELILAGLASFNVTQAGPGGHRPICFLVRDEESGAVGGLWGTTAYDWLIVELLFVPESLRGRGTGAALIRRAEEEARRRGCIGAWLDTFSFQARGFYERLGYELSGRIPDHPIGGARYFMMKRWSV